MANGAPTVSNGLIVSGVTTVTTLDLNGDLDVDGHLNADNVSIAGVVTATSFSGSGANLTSLPAQATIANNADNRVITGGSGVNLNGESNLTFDGSTLNVSGKITNSASYTSHNANFYGGDVNTGGVRIEVAHSTTSVSGNTASASFPHHLLLSNYSGTGSADNRMCSIGFDIPTTSTHANAVIAYQATAAGTGDLQFHLESGNSISEKLRITSGGQVNIGTGELTQTARKLNVYGGATRVTQTSGGNTVEVFGHTTSGQSYGLLVNAGSTSGDYCANFRNSSGTTLFRIRGDGNLGINETSPDTKLHISHSNATEDVIKLEATPVTAATGERSRIIFNVTQSNGQAAKLGHIASHTLNGWGGELAFHTKPANSTPNNSTNEVMRLHANGYVTKPYQPMCSFTVASTSAGNYMTHHDMRTNNGSHFNTSNNRFVCPVAGFYYASIMVMSNNSNTTMDLELHKNGSNASNILVPYSAATGGQYNQAVGSCIIECSANDYLQFRLNSGSVYQGRHSNITFCLLA